MLEGCKCSRRRRKGRSGVLKDSAIKPWDGWRQKWKRFGNFPRFPNLTMLALPDYSLEASKISWVEEAFCALAEPDVNKALLSRIS